MIISRENLFLQIPKNQKITEVCQRVLDKLRICAAEQGEECSFTVNQLRTKFKKAVAECRKVALTMKTATGIKSFQEENGYGLWFNELFTLVRTRDSCKPEQAIEPMATSRFLNEIWERLALYIMSVFVVCAEFLIVYSQWLFLIHRRSF